MDEFGGIAGRAFKIVLLVARGKNEKSVFILGAGSGKKTSFPTCCKHPLKATNEG